VQQAGQERAGDEQEGRHDAGHADRPDGHAPAHVRAEVGRFREVDDGDLDRSHAHEQGQEDCERLEAHLGAAQRFTSERTY
jgi:hypothetical protein